MKIGILTYLATYGNAPLLASSLELLGHDIRLIIAERDAYGFYEKYPSTYSTGQCWRVKDPTDMKRACAWLKNVDRLVCIALPSITMLLELIVKSDLWTGPNAIDFLRDRGGVAIFSSSHLLKHPDEANRILVETELKAMAMADKLIYIHSAKTACYWPPIHLPEFHAKIDNPLIIGHSVGKKSRNTWKGTSHIRRIFDELESNYDVKCRIQYGLNHADSIIGKKDFHVFVDQIPQSVKVKDRVDWRGGLGKSGLEAMAYGAATIAAHHGDQPLVDNPPIIYARRENLNTILKELICNHQQIEDVGADCRKWIHLNCDPLMVAKNVETRLL